MPSRWQRDPDAAADRLIGGLLPRLDLAGCVLIVSDFPEALRAALAARGIATALWARRVSRERLLDAAAPVAPLAAPWPPAGPFDAALVRLPKAKGEQEMAIAAALSVLAQRGRVIVYGGNDEGIRSAARLIAAACGATTTIAAQAHGRVLAGLRPLQLTSLRTTLAAWRQVTSARIGAHMRPWVSYPGIFAAGGIDEGTALLAAHLPVLAPGKRVLDFACGSGAIAASALAQNGAIVLEVLDNDAVALAACAENVPTARRILGRGLADAPGRYDVILSNPPLHRGIASDHALLDELVSKAPSHLNALGMLALVVPRHVPLAGPLSRHFAEHAILAETPRYRVWRAQRLRQAAG